MMIQNHDVGAGDKKGAMEYVISLDKIMVTEFQDFLVVCFTLGMPGIYCKYKIKNLVSMKILLVKIEMKACSLPLVSKCTRAER